MNFVRRILIILLITCVAGCGKPAVDIEKTGKPDGPSWTYFTRENGHLLSNNVLAVCYQATGSGDGFLWVGTDAGIARLHGDKWEPFTTETGALLPSNVVRCIEVDPRVPSTVWFGCDGGLARFDAGKDRWMKIPGPSVRSIAFENQLLWVGTFGGIRKFDGSTWVDISKERSGLLDNKINVLATQENALWIGTNQGLNRYYDSRRQWEQYTGGHKVVDMISGNIRAMAGNSGLVQNQVYDIEIDDSTIWFATAGGVSTFSTSGKIWTSYTADHTDWETRGDKRIERPVPGNSGLVNNRVKAIEKLTDTMAIGSIGGLNTFDGTTWKQYTTENSDLPFNRITCLEAAPDCLWIGLENYGLARVVFK